MLVHKQATLTTSCFWKSKTSLNTSCSLSSNSVSSLTNCARPTTEDSKTTASLCMFSQLDCYHLLLQIFKTAWLKRRILHLLTSNCLVNWMVAAFVWGSRSLTAYVRKRWVGLVWPVQHTLPINRSIWLVELFLWPVSGRHVWAAIRNAQTLTSWGSERKDSPNHIDYGYLIND